MNHGALDDALESRGRFGGLARGGDEIFKLGVDVVKEILPQLIEIDRASPHHGRGVRIVDQAQQEMFERGELMPPLAGGVDGAVERLFKGA